MKTRTKYAATIIALALTCSARAEPPKGYTLAWSDEFNGTEVDKSKWLYRLDSNWGSTQLESNVTVENGLLRIALKKEQARKKNYTGGGIITKKDFVYGYYECRFKVPATLGWHTSFWMSDYDESNPNKVGGLGLHEMDVCEHDSWKHDSYTRALWMRKPKVEGQKPKLEGWKRIPTPDLTKDFHVWGCEFTPTNVIYFFNGQEIKNWDVSAYETGIQRIWLSSIAANLGKKTGDPVDSELPAYAEFDYVRFYEKAK
jgi:beta-glucanase (GH16 family)